MRMLLLALAMTTVLGASAWAGDCCAPCSSKCGVSTTPCDCRPDTCCKTKPRCSPCRTGDPWIAPAQSLQSLVRRQAPKPININCCCPRDEYRLICVCSSCYTLCCAPTVYELLCEPKCKVECRPSCEPRCKQDICNRPQCVCER
jgi:hypothetical protein